MLLDQIAKPTPIGNNKMSVADFFNLCAQMDIPGIPYADESGKLVGRLSLRHVVKESFIPEHASHVAHLMSDTHIPNLLQDKDISHCLQCSVESFVLKDLVTLSQSAPLYQIMAKMEKFNTGYLFVVEDNKYYGIITRRDVIRSFMNYQGQDTQ